jgi:hypothetical protein
MELLSKINGVTYQVILDRVESIAIELDFEGKQPQHFGVSPASAKPYLAGSFVGDTRQGGSCNCDEITLVPHCVGTHTESIGHVTDDHRALIDCVKTFITPATLISVVAESGEDCNENYQPLIENADSIISLKALQQKLGSLEDNKNNEFIKTLIVRTLPNLSEKQFNQYGDDCRPPFFSNDAMDFISQLPIEHLIVDVPSIDKMYDDGMLSNHRIFWALPPLGKAVDANSQTQRTVTELAFIDNSIKDGLYLMNLQFPAWRTDAVPSKPTLYPLIKI